MYASYHNGNLLTVDSTMLFTFYLHYYFTTYISTFIYFTYCSYHHWIVNGGSVV